VTNEPLITAIGVISGTSMDGIDVSIIDTDGANVVKPGPGRIYHYTDDLRRELLKLIETPEVAERAPLEEIEIAVSDAHAMAVLSFLRDHNIAKESVSLVGLHGQTVFHRPERRFTRQLGIGARVAKALGINVVNRFRHADVAAGGEGAPLAPLYHRALASKLEHPVMVLNLGGVANVTYIDGETVIAFDTGPASALLDDFVRRRIGKAYDEDGKLASTGTVDKSMLASLMKHPFFDRKPPKSLDRQDFRRHAQMVDRLSNEDGAATLAAFTVASVADSLRHVPTAPKRWLVCGGGRFNRMLMRLLAERVGVSVEPVEAVGWNGDFIEAQCFGYLAVRSVRGLPLSLPSTTGVPVAMTGGELWRAA
jgi:anhydro-N-acetylmuramic acid kinase